MSNRATATTKAEYLKELQEKIHAQYKEATAVFEILSFLRDAAGDPTQEVEWKLTDSGLCGLRRILDDLARRSEFVMCKGLYDFQLDMLADYDANQE